LENNFSLGKKGQASIEFIFLIIIILVYIHAILYPTVTYATSAANDAKRISEASFAAQKLADAINYVSSSSGDSVQILSVFIPKEATISCSSVAAVCSPSPNCVVMETALDPATGPSAACGGTTTCTKSYAIAQSLNCGNSSGPLMQRYKVSKTGGTTSAAPI